MCETRLQCNSGATAAAQGRMLLAGVKGCMYVMQFDMEWGTSAVHSADQMKIF